MIVVWGTILRTILNHFINYKNTKGLFALQPLCAKMYYWINYIFISQNDPCSDESVKTTKNDILYIPASRWRCHFITKHYASANIRSCSPQFLFSLSILPQTVRLDIHNTYVHFFFFFYKITFCDLQRFYRNNFSKTLKPVYKVMQI